MVSFHIMLIIIGIPQLLAFLHMIYDKIQTKGSIYLLLITLMLTAIRTDDTSRAQGKGAGDNCFLEAAAEKNKIGMLLALGLSTPEPVTVFKGDRR